MIIVLDTNPVYKDYHLRGSLFATLFLLLQKTDYRLIVPQIVFDEIRKHHKEELAAQLSAIRRAIKECEKLTGSSINCPSTIKKIEAEISNYEFQLSDRLAEVHAELADYPAVSHQDVINRLVSQRHPFKAQGAGYQDTLIWETVLELAAGTEENILFVSDNKEDFYASNGEDLHPDLVDDLRARGIDPDRVTGVRNLHLLLEKHLGPLMQAAEQEARKLLSLEQSTGRQLRSTIMSMISSFLSGWIESSYVLLSIPRLPVEPTVTFSGAPEDIEVVSAYQLPDSKLFVTLQGRTWWEMEAQVPSLWYGSMSPADRQAFEVGAITGPETERPYLRPDAARIRVLCDD